MKRARWALIFFVLFFFCAQGEGLAETMYVTDLLYLSLRDAPDSSRPSLRLLKSATRVEVLQIDGGWAQIMLDDGKKGWVQKKFLVEKLQSSDMTEELQLQLEDKDRLLRSLQGENASLKGEIAQLEKQGAERVALKREIEELRSRIARQNQSLEIAEEKYRWENRKILYVTGLLALAAGFLMGFILKRPNRHRYYLK
ncbi:MAG: TIGR04211 family SH3 domain-containing protein [Proteobacteria bacterium]|nr:TIGR04211 family SH3 domain-containing protein [Pseudomonadota bacterium]NIS69767.1 TIGR04211 family SH3 domain-containing protein [Pseudomonadota bacterium]